MEKILRCIDLTSGFERCTFEACEDTPEEVLKTAANHARSIHRIKVSKKDLERARTAIQDAFCVPKGGYNPRGGTY